jgi:protein-disulfide isomerase
METKKIEWLLPASILIAAVLISGSIIYLVRSGSAVKAPGGFGGGNAEPGTLTGGNVTKLGERDVVMGDPSAPVMVIEYADFQCPFCGKFYMEAGASIRDKYVKSGKVKMVYRDFAFLGPESTAAAEAAECAKDQGKFWSYHDALYTAEIADGEEGNGNLNKTLFMKLAKDVGMDTGKFESCIDSKKYAAVVANIVAEAQAAGVNSTPTIFVGSEKILGAQPFSVFQAAIDKLLGS